MRRAILALALSLAMASPAYASAPKLMHTTAYTMGDTCARGDKAREGIVAGMPEWYGAACIVYRAIPDGAGYKLGRAIGIFEVLDTGYGKSTKDGIQSRIRKDKDSRGTIEVGQCIDRYSESMDSAMEWMQETGGMCFVQIIEDVKG